MSGPKITLKALALVIERQFQDLVAIAYPANHPLGGFCNTDRKIPGTRCRRVGKGRRGTRLVVTTRPGRHHPSGLADNVQVFEHNAAQTYRTNQDVVEWIRREELRRSRWHSLARITQLEALGDQPVMVERAKAHVAKLELALGYLHLDKG